MSILFSLFGYIIKSIDINLQVTEACISANYYLLKKNIKKNKNKNVI